MFFWPGITLRRVDGRNRNGDEFPCLVQQRCRGELLDFPSIDQKFDPISTFVCFFQHIAQSGNERGFRFREAGGTVKRDYFIRRNRVSE